VVDQWLIVGTWTAERRRIRMKKVVVDLGILIFFLCCVM
jgi:hypothetical protein